MKNNNNNLTKKGFTLIELMVVITIIAIMASIAIFGLPAVSQKGQDTQRLAGLRELQLAIESYKNINGKYPEKRESGKEYVVGLTPGYIQKLPQDTKQGGGFGYKYVVEPENYKTYCVGVIGTVNKNSTQPDLEYGEKSWVSCNGNADEIPTLKSEIE